jgi:hypothetical protein
MAAAQGLSARAQSWKFYAGLARELIAYARHEFALSRAAAAGGTEREHLKGALARAKTAERRREIDAELAGPPFPRPLRYLWAIFAEIAEGLDASFGPPVISWQTLDAWSRLTGVRLEAREAITLVRLGRVRAEALDQDAT